MYYRKYIHYRPYPPPVMLPRRWYHREYDDYPYLYRPYYTPSPPLPYMYYPLIETPGELLGYYDTLRTELS